MLQADQEGELGTTTDEVSSQPAEHSQWHCWRHTWIDSAEAWALSLRQVPLWQVCLFLGSDPASESGRILQKKIQNHANFHKEKSDYFESLQTKNVRVLLNITVSFS